MSRNKYPQETVNLILEVSLKRFLEKGFENTSIQNIIDGLGGLSKGAIYHHFKSKEDILEAVCNKIGDENAAVLEKIRDDKYLNGYGKLKKMFQTSLSSPGQDLIFSVAPNLMKNPRFLAIQLQEVFTIVAPQYIQPILEQGIRDGSIKTDYPKELSEVMILLTNIWLNPMIIETNTKDLLNRVHFFNSLLKAMGLELLDKEMTDSYVRYCDLYNAKKH